MNRERSIETLLVTAGRDPEANHGIVNPPVYHASTIVFPTLDAFEQADRTPFDGTRYGRRGTPTTFALEDAVAEMEGGHRAIAVPSGLAAITMTLLAFLKAGDRLLMVDTVYAPVRRFCDSVLPGLGITTHYYDPMADIAPLLNAETKVVFAESPGSLTYEVQDLDALAAAAGRIGARLVLDNTWSAGLLLRPFAHGVDVSIQAATKYIVGHSDVMLGVITTTEDCFLPVRRATSFFGTAAGPDDCYLALRGLRTLKPRLDRHAETALIVADWLAHHPDVIHVRHPALAGCPGHDIWERDFTGSNGLLSIVLKDTPRPALAAMLDPMELFGLGYSWGGFESLIVPFTLAGIRTASTWPYDGTCLRLHCGLENPEDLIADLDAAFARRRRMVG